MKGATQIQVRPKALRKFKDFSPKLGDWGHIMWYCLYPSALQQKYSVFRRLWGFFVTPFQSDAKADTQGGAAAVLLFLKPCWQQCCFLIHRSRGWHSSNVSVQRAGVLPHLSVCCMNWSQAFVFGPRNRENLSLLIHEPAGCGCRAFRTPACSCPQRPSGECGAAYQQGCQGSRYQGNERKTLCEIPGN